MAFTDRAAEWKNGAMVKASETKLGLGILAASRELGVKALIQRVGDAAAVGTDKTQKYLGTYTKHIKDAADKAEKAAAAAYDAIMAEPKLAREGAKGTDAELIVPNYTDEQIEALVGLAFTQSYKMEMAKVNAKFPIAQEILTKYMTNFKVHSV